MEGDQILDGNEVTDFSRSNEWYKFVCPFALCS